MKKVFLFAFLFLAGKVAFAQYSAMAYITAHKDAAVQIMKEHGIPASIVLGVAIHESAYGNSIVAKKLHNHFGIKGRISEYFHRNKKVTSSYKKYDSALDSYQDFAGLLTGRKQFAHLANKYDSTDWAGWARGIQRAGYAASHTWASQVMAIIKKYKLDDYDYAEAQPAAANSGEKTSIQSASPAPAKAAETEVAEANFYHVKRGDNLSVIASKTHVSVKSLRAKNHLKSTRLKPGQRLKL